MENNNYKDKLYEFIKEMNMNNALSTEVSVIDLEDDGIGITVTTTRGTQNYFLEDYLQAYWFVGGYFIGSCDGYKSGLNIAMKVHEKYDKRL